VPWGVVGMAAAAAYGSYEDQKAQEDARKDNKEMTELGFQRQAWLDQQQRKWNLEDRKYVEDATAGFRGFAPEMARNMNGVQVQTPTPTSTEGLAQFDPNKPGAIEFGLKDEDYAKPKPLMSAGGMYG
jgi:hypothetical protein